jgi:hypothetical protein
LYIVRGTKEFDVASLRQGDILQGIPFPLMDHAKIQVLGDVASAEDFISIPILTPKMHNHRGDPEWATAVAPVRFGFCAVLTNCCDLEPRDGKVLVHAVVLARLRSIPEDIKRNQTQFDSLRANKDPRDRTDAGYIEYFYLESHELLQQQDWRVHFNQVVSLPTTDITMLLRRKVLQLDDRTRMKFKIKLGFTFMRANEGELNAGLENPWQDERQRQ